jgi:K+-transporting ATPase A subunit
MEDVYSSFIELSVQNFLSAAIGIAAVVAVIRGDIPAL